MLAAVTGRPPDRRDRGFREAWRTGRRHPAGPDRLPQLPVGQARSRRAPDSGAERTERRRQDKPARGDIVSVPRPGFAQCPARRHRSSRRRVPDEPASPGWAVAATVELRHGTVRIGTGRDGNPALAFSPRACPPRACPPRGCRVRNAVRSASTASHCAASRCWPSRFGVLWLTPQMDRLFVEGPEARRRFMDRLVLGIDPAHAARVGRYEQAMRERSRLLREGRADPAWLAALEVLMSDRGVAVAAARCDAIERLDPGLRHGDGEPFRAPGFASPARSRHGWPRCPRWRSRTGFAPRWPRRGGRWASGWAGLDRTAPI